VPEFGQDLPEKRALNYNVRTAVNDIFACDDPEVEQWQAPTFDLKTIDQELGWAEKIGYTSGRPAGIVS
jgi:hypothetical protein